MTEYKQKQKSLTEYEQLKASRQKTLVKQLEQFLNQIKSSAARQILEDCEQKATKNGEVDEIDEKLCLRNSSKAFEHKLINILPRLTQHSTNYQQCLKQCQKNRINYVIANQSCRNAYEKQFRSTARAIFQELTGTAFQPN